MATIKLSDYLGHTEADIKKSMNQDITQPWHDCNDNAYTSASKQSVSAGQEYAFENNGLAYEATNFPTHITKLWDKTTHKCYFNEVLDTPMYVAKVAMNFLPGVSAESYMEVFAYIDETVPIKIGSIRLPYKATDSRLEALFTFYIGTVSGYDLKAKGLKFTYKPQTNGQVYNRSILVYKT